MTQEQIVDNKVLDLLETKLNGSKELILQNTTKSSRRLAMLSILDDDRRLLEKYKELVKKESYCSEYAEEAVVLLREYVKVADMEVKDFGEVMTPLYLVEEKLDKFPPEVWSQPDKKWLEPCNGVGTYVSVIIKKLMNGLKNVIEDDCERYRHIIENMIYVCELQPKNMFLYHCIFDRNDEYSLNTFCGSFLSKEFDKHMTKTWDVTEFDFIVGNFPFQIKVGDDKTEPIWDDFFLKCIGILKKNGYLSPIHPSGWRNINGRFKKVKEEVKKRKLHYLSIQNEKKGLEVFKKETRFDYYLLQNIESTEFETLIHFQDKTEKLIDIKNIDFIPNGSYDEIFSYVAKDDEEKVNVLYSRSDYGTDKKHMQKISDDEFIHPCIYTVNHLSEPSFYYSKKNTNGHFGIPKVIWSNGRISSVGSFVDINGDYGLTQFSYAIIDNPNNLPSIKVALDSKKFKNLMELCAVGQLTINYKIISTFKKEFWKEFI